MLLGVNVGPLSTVYWKLKANKGFRLRAYRGKISTKHLHAFIVQIAREPIVHGNPLKHMTMAN